MGRTLRVVFRKKQINNARLAIAGDAQLKGKEGLEETTSMPLFKNQKKGPVNGKK